MLPDGHHRSDVPPDSFCFWLAAQLEFHVLVDEFRFGLLGELLDAAFQYFFIR